MPAARPGARETLVPKVMTSRIRMCPPVLAVYVDVYYTSAHAQLEAHPCCSGSVWSAGGYVYVDCQYGGHNRIGLANNFGLRRRPFMMQAKGSP